MEVTINVPDELFQEFINNCEKKSGHSLNYISEQIKNVKEYKINESMKIEDEKLYLWLAALTFTDMVNNLFSK